MTDRVGVSGMGIISSIGDSVCEFSNSLKTGRSGISQSTTINDPEVSVGIAAKLQNFSFQDALGHFESIPEETIEHARGLGRRAPLVIQTSIISALEAWSSAGLFDKKPLPQRMGLIVAGQNSTQNYQYGLISKFRKNPQYLSPRYALEFLETNQLGVLSELFDIQGEGLVVGGASATGNVGIIKGYQAIVSGMVDVCLVVGVMADLSPMDVQGFVNIGAMGGKVYKDQPESACRPFDTQHEGFIYGQSSACIVLESETSALKRGAPTRAQLAGTSMNLDANSASNPSAEGEAKAMLSALRQAGLRPSDVDYINTHGSSSPLGDKTEAEAIAKVFKGDTTDLWLNSTKSLTGHCLYSAGIVEAIASIIQLNEGFLHPNLNLETPISNVLNFCGNESTNYPMNIAMSNSFGFGGINTCVVINKWQ